MILFSVSSCCYFFILYWNIMCFIDSGLISSSFIQNIQIYTLPYFILFHIVSFSNFIRYFSFSLLQDMWVLTHSPCDSDSFVLSFSHSQSHNFHFHIHIFTMKNMRNTGLRLNSRPFLQFPL